MEPGTATLTMGGIAAIATAAWWLWRSRPWRGPRTRHPVVLVHGVLGFDEVKIGNQRQSYFRGVAEHLERRGVTVYQPVLPPLGSIVERARVLAAALARLPESRVNLIAHSMGGLDARYAISRLGCDRRVASLTTIGTPHRGTPLADLGSALLGERFGLGPLLGMVGLAPVRDMSTARMAAFNREVPDRRGVRYASVVASVRGDEERIHPILRLSSEYLRRNHGPGDGLVPASSQAWGKVLQEVPADHWAQIGWSGDFNAPAFYERLLRLLRRRGL